MACKWYDVTGAGIEPFVNDGDRFLLAVLYLDSINRCRNLDYVRKSITELPKGPDAYGEIYCNTMVRIQSRETRYLAIQVLSWVAWSKRPLTARELQHALVITEGSMSLNEDNITDAEDLVSSCEGLVTLNSKTNTVGLVHSTTREYLETIRDTYFPSVENDVLFVCLELLSSPYFQKGACKTDAEFQERLRDYPLYDYASRYWGDHAGNTTGMEESLVAFLGDIPKVDAASQCQLTYRGRCQSVPFGVTGVHLAATYGLDTVVDSLLSSGCGADLRTSYGQSPLFFSVACGSQSTVAILLRHNAQVGAVDVFGRTALSFAAEFGQLEIAKNLSSQGARVDFKDGFGRSPLSDASEAGHEAMARYLLENFPNVQIDEKENSGRTPLWRAASKGHWGVVKLLAAHGANIDTHLQGGPTLVGWAVENGKRDALDNLIAMGANVNLTDGDGRTPLSHAAEEGSLFIVTTLLANGADSNLADEDGWSPLMWASDSGKHDVVSALLRHGHPHPNILEHTYRFGQTALSLASRAGHAVVVELLLGHDLQRTTVKMSDETGWTPLIQSAKHGSSKVLSLLLDKQGAAGNVVHCDCAGKTALHWAARLGHVAAMQTLLEGGAFIDATDNVGRTPLWYAVRNGHAEAVEVLLKANAATHVSDMLERTPLQLAIENGHDCIAEMLLGHGAELEASVGPQWVFLHISSLTASLLVREHAKRVSSKEGGEADVLGLGILFA
jgi:ankyrin repeat protein